MKNIIALRGSLFAEQTTGCKESGRYYAFAQKHGYNFVEVLDWSSSAGDWSFIISKDGKTWKILSQTNNYPRAGFSYEISDEKYCGSEEEVIKQIVEMYY